MTRFLPFAFLALSSVANAIVIRHDVDDAKYLVRASEFPALADMPGEGHGVLIAPRWVVTAAHAVTWQSRIKAIVINGIPRDVERLILHAGYKKPPQELIDQALATGDATLVMVFLASSDDIALLELAKPVTDVSPVALYTGNDELGQVIEIFGKGATGTGATGYGPHASHRTRLRRAFNRISSSHDRWLCYVFDQPPSALPLEGMAGNGDSGGPALIQVRGQWLLAGLTSWKAVQGDARTVRLGLYGQANCNVRISHYIDWIEGTMSSRQPAGTDN